MKLGIISKNATEYVMMSAAVAGGFVLVGCDTANRVRLWDDLSRLSGSAYETHYLAMLPGSTDVPMREVSREHVAGLIDASLASAESRSWCRESRDEDVAVLRDIRARVIAMGNEVAV